MSAAEAVHHPWLQCGDDNDDDDHDSNSSTTTVECDATSIDNAGHGPASETSTAPVPPVAADAAGSSLDLKLCLPSVKELSIPEVRTRRRTITAACDSARTATPERCAGRRSSVSSGGGGASYYRMLATAAPGAVPHSPVALHRLDAPPVVASVPVARAGSSSGSNSNSNSSGGVQVHSATTPAVVCGTTAGTATASCGGSGHGRQWLSGLDGGLGLGVVGVGNTTAPIAPQLSEFAGTVTASSSKTLAVDSDSDAEALPDDGVYEI